MVFLGNVRDHSQGRRVTDIEYSAYERLAEVRLGTIVAELETERPGLRVAIVHRLGRLDVGETSVAIVTASAHREAAYEANRIALERVKSESAGRTPNGDIVATRAWREVEPLS